MNIPKDYLGTEQARNKAHAALYEKLVKLAFGDNNAVLVGHHIGFETDGDINTENEIPSADCLLFDHTIMLRVFGDRMNDVLIHLALTPCEERDSLAAQYLEEEMTRRGRESQTVRINLATGETTESPWGEPLTIGET